MNSLSLILQIIALLVVLYITLNCLFEALLPHLKDINEKHDTIIIRVLLVSLVISVSSSLGDFLRFEIPLIAYALGSLNTRHYLSTSKDNPEKNSPIHQMFNYVSFLWRKRV